MAVKLQEERQCTMVKKALSLQTALYNQQDRNKMTLKELKQRKESQIHLQDQLCESGLTPTHRRSPCANSQSQKPLQDKKRKHSISTVMFLIKIRAL